MGKLADSAFPGIVDVVEQEEERFLIMEWIEGETLAVQMERDGAFAEETVIEIGICLAKAIQKLHQMQPPLLYLDCKPVKCDEGFRWKNQADRFWQRAGSAYTRDKKAYPRVPDMRRRSS